MVIGMGAPAGPRPATTPGLSTRRSTPVWSRRFGAGALMLAHVAAGQLHAYYEAHMNSWDALAGMLLIEEAGGTCNAFLANAALRRGNLVLAGCASVQPDWPPCWRNDVTPPVSDRRRDWLTPGSLRGILFGQRLIVQRTGKNRSQTARHRHGKGTMVAHVIFPTAPRRTP